jgi:hypothetical protein
MSSPRRPHRSGSPLGDAMPSAMQPQHTRVGARLLLVAALVLTGLTLTSGQPSYAAAAPRPGPVLTTLPVLLSGDALATGKDNPTAGPAALNSAVATACNSGRGLVAQHWWTLPTSLPAGGPQQVYGRGFAQFYDLGRAAQSFRAHVALADYASGQVLSCTGGPLAVTAAHPLALVMWFDADLLGCVDGEPNYCSVDPYQLVVGTTTGTSPVNLDAATARTVPTQATFTETADSTFTNTDLDDLAAIGKVDCTDAIEPEAHHAVWWRYQATVTGDLPAAVDVQQLPLGGGSVAPVSLVLLEHTADGWVSNADPACDGSGPLQVTAGHTYYLVASVQYDAYLTAQNTLGAPFTLRVAPVDTPRVTSTVNDLHNGSVQVRADTAVATGYVFTAQSAGSSPVTASVAPGTGGYAPHPLTSASHTFTGLVPGRVYTFTAAAKDPVGTGLPEVSVLRLFMTSGVTGLHATVSTATRTARVTWTAPAQVGPSPVTGYRVSRSGTDSTGTGAFDTTVGAATRSFTFGALQLGPVYDLVVQPVTAAGLDDAGGAQMTVALGGPPGPPQQVQAFEFSGDAGNINLSWTPPRDYGRPAVTGYRVSRDGTDSATSGAYSKVVSASATSFTFGFLNGNELYHFSVQALSGAGYGDTVTSAYTQFADTPGQPAAVNAAGGVRKATVFWTPPTVPGSSTVTGYRIRRFAGATRTVQRTTVVAAGVRSLAATGLAPGTTYSFDVSPINSYGTGSPRRSPVVTTSA